jgi:8-oxo-dGTP pyrophosphatase MutT (NUDIX family)
MARFFTDAQGNRHWGEHGAAGMLAFHVKDGQVWYLLQKRSLYTHGGGTWSIPGGALRRDETPVEGARREAVEELGLLPDGLTPIGTVVTDFGGWQYHTIVFQAAEMFAAGGNWEAAEHRWVTAAGTGRLLLHPGFAAAFPQARQIAEAPPRSG